MLHFKKDVSLPVTAQEAFDWHARPGAFERLSPPWQQIKIIEPASSLADGTRLTFRLYQGPVPMRWVAEHRDVIPGVQFRDVQMQGPFSSWTHTHSFKTQSDGCVLQDEIEYGLPMGKLGEFLAGWKIRHDLESAFTFRHRTTREDMTLHAQYRDQPRLRIAVTGASGLVGSALCALLGTGGHQVIRLVRRAPKAADEVQWDPASGLVDPAQLEGIDAVVALAGENVAGGRWTAERKRRLIFSRVDAIERLIASLRQLAQPPKTFICASAIGFYGNRADEIVDETSTRGTGFLADLTERWENAAASADQFGARRVSLRFGVVLSPRGGALAKMLPAFSVGAGGPLGSGRQYLAWVSIDDAIGAIHHALMNSDLQGSINVTAPEPVTQRHFASVLGKILKRPAIIPAPALALHALFGEMAQETVLASTRAVPTRLLDSGYAFRQPELIDTLKHLLGRVS